MENWVTNAMRIVSDTMKDQCIKRGLFLDNNKLESLTLTAKAEILKNFNAVAKELKLECKDSDSKWLLLMFQQKYREIGKEIIKNYEKYNRIHKQVV